MPDLEAQLKAWTDQTDPITAEEARTRASEPALPLAPTRRPGAGGLLDSPSRRLLAAAAVVLVVVGGVIAATQMGDSDEVRISEQPQQPGATDPTPAPSPTTTRPAPVETAEPPPTWVGADERGRLVLADTATGEVIRVLAELDDPEAVGEPGLPEGMGRFLGPVAISPDGDTVYYETCCEPAVGEIFRVPTDGGEPERFTYGTDPALSSDGAYLAVVESQALKVIELATGREARIESPEPPMALRRPSFSPSGLDIVFEWYGGPEGHDVPARIMRQTGTPALFDLASRLDLGSAPTLAARDDDLAPTNPMYGPGGLEVVYEALPAGDQPPREVWLRVLSIDESGDEPTTVLESEQQLETWVLSRSRPHQGGPVLTTFASGRVAYQDPDGEWVTVAEGFFSAAW